MKKDVMVIRESIGRIVSMLTMQSVKVTQRGSKAYVRYNPKTGAIVEMNIPYIPDDASDEFISAIQGFLDHEVGHVLYSDSKALNESVKFGKRVQNIANVIEDVYVEREMTKAFRGSGSNLESVRKFYLEKIARPKIEEALARGAIDEACGYATVAAFRGWGGQTSAMDFIREPKIAALVADVEAKLGPELISKLTSCRNSMDCLELAKQFKEKLETPKPKEPTPPTPLPPAGEPTDDDYDDRSEDEGESGEGKSHVETDDSGKTGSDESKVIDGETDAGAEGADAPGESKPPESDPEIFPEKDKDGTHEEEPSSEEPSDESAGLGLDGSSDSASDTREEVEGGESTPSDSGASESSEGDDSPESKRGDSSPDVMPKPDETPEPDPIADIFDTERDFDKDLGDRLSADAKAEILSASYAVFSTEWDKVEPAPLSKNPKSVEKLEHGIRDTMGVMQKHLERAISAQAKKCWNPGQTRGRIAPGSLFKTAVGNDKIFRQRFETKAKNTALSLVVDCSGSMTGERISIAGSTAFALASVLERLGVEYEVIGFTSSESSEMIELMKIDSGGAHISIAGWARIEPLYIPVFKPFGGKLDSKAKSRIAHLIENPGWLLQNIDGESIQIAAQRLVQKKADRHIMIVMSDGDPSCIMGKGLSAHLKKTVKELTKKGVEIVGIGIQTTAVESFYPKNIVLNNLEELPTRVMAELTKLLLAA